MLIYKVHFRRSCLSTLTLALLIVTLILVHNTLIYTAAT